MCPDDLPMERKNVTYNGRIDILNERSTGKETMHFFNECTREGKSYILHAAPEGITTLKR